MRSESKICQNCKKDFTIEPDDFSFYEKIKVPPPTFCPECRSQRRMAWRNERSLYKRTCDLCKKNIIAMYPNDFVSPVYCKDCWYSDKWDAEKYGKEYDFSRPFFKQFKELYDAVPKLGLWQRSTINSPYSNMCGECKNVYLSVSVVLGSENIFYSKSVDKSSNIFDSFNIQESESLYENIECEKNYNCQYVKLSRNCIDSYFLIDCVNCSNCFLCSNLRNKEYCIRNKQYSKEDYSKEIQKSNLGSRKVREALIQEFDDICLKAIYRYANIIKSVSSSGNNLLNTKNCKDCFDTCNSENIKYGYRCLNNMKDSMDIFFSSGSEMLYEYTTGSLNDYNVKFSYSAMNHVRNADYTESCVDSTDIFGCVGIKNKKYVVLNKVYTKEDYEKLRENIIKQMGEIPYIDRKGRIYKYGEFFPIEISSFAYNETSAQDFFPLTKEEAEKEGYSWREPGEKIYNITVDSMSIPDDIKDTKENILNEVLGCIHEDKCEHQCTKAFRLTQDEFNFYKKHNIPIPNKCPNCRYNERFLKLLLPRLWQRKCMKKDCTNEFETPYSPDRPEIVYCERCYQQEVY
ncbi:MAG: hypothetical protein WCS86_01105 [Candidatus Paceibacterota bacterium]